VEVGKVKQELKEGGSMQVLCDRCNVLSEFQFEEEVICRKGMPLRGNSWVRGLFFQCPVCGGERFTGVEEVEGDFEGEYQLENISNKLGFGLYKKVPRPLGITV
jgi:hypothetical protein